MNRRNGAKLEVRLRNFSPPRVTRPPSPSRSMSISPTSSLHSSCVSEEDESYQQYYSSSPEAQATSSMVLVGCPMCLMYVMLSEDDPKCPKCKSTVLLDVVHNNTTTTTTSTTTNRSRTKKN